MKQYENFGGNSTVRYYEYNTNYITVKFNNGIQYTYTYNSAGISNVENMKKLADAGRGLGSYIMRNCRTRYASKS